MMSFKSQKKSSKCQKHFSLSPIPNSLSLLSVNYEAMTLDYENTNTEREVCDAKLVILSP